MFEYMPLQTISSDKCDKKIEWMLNMTNGKYDEPFQKQPNRNEYLKHIIKEFMFWLFSYVLSFLFVIFPYFVEPEVQINQLIPMVFRDYALPVLAITTSFTTIAELLKSSNTKISKGVFIYHFFFVIVSMFIYTAYFIGAKTQPSTSNIALDYSYICSGVIIGGSIIGELIYAVRCRKEEL